MTVQNDYENCFSLQVPQELRLSQEGNTLACFCLVACSLIFSDLMFLKGIKGGQVFSQRLIHIPTCLNFKYLHDGQFFIFFVVVCRFFSK